MQVQRRVLANLQPLLHGRLKVGAHNNQLISRSNQTISAYMVSLITLNRVLE
jgi:hypothetical protein